MDVLVICRDALCSKEIHKEKLNLISKGQATLCQLNLTKVNDGLIDLE